MLPKYEKKGIKKYSNMLHWSKRIRVRVSARAGINDLE